jgi:hypothetical protein
VFLGFFLHGSCFEARDSRCRLILDGPATIVGAQAD